MPGHARPLLLLDVDGVLALFGAAPEGAQAPTDAEAFQLPDGRVVRVRPVIRTWLAELERVFTLVWASGWEEKANELLLPVFGLHAPLPLITFHDLGADAPSDPDEPWTGTWKLHPVRQALARRGAAAWIDDEINEDAYRWAAARPAPTLLLSARPWEGITREHVDELLRFAAANPIN